MAEITDITSLISNLGENSNDEVTQEQIKQYEEFLTEMLENSDDDDPIKQIFKMLALDEENFAILAPGILQSFQQSVNNPNDKLALVQSLNANGGKAEDLIALFIPLNEEINKMEDLSQQKKDFVSEIVATLINAIQETEGISKRIIQVPIELCHPEAKIPQYAHIDDSGMDIYALDDYTIAPGETMLIPTGFKVALPPGYELQVRPKSGRALKTKLRIANTPGTIDAGYRDEVGVIVENVDPPIRAIHFDETIVAGSIEYGQFYTIGKGEKFAQLVLSEVPKAAFFRVDKVDEIGENRNGGFGSTGL